MTEGRERRTIVYSRQTGAVTRTFERLPGASFEERIRELKASLPGSDLDEAEARFLTLRCDSCGWGISVDWDDPRLPEDWESQPKGEFCPGCVAEGRTA